MSTRLHTLRLAAGLTVSELSRRTGFSRTAIRLVEAGRRQASPTLAAKLAAALDDPALAQLFAVRKRGRPVLGHSAQAVRRAFGCEGIPKPLPRFEVAYHSGSLYRTGRRLLDAVLQQRRAPQTWRILKLVARHLNGIEQLAVLHLLGAEARAVSIFPHRLEFPYPSLKEAGVPWIALVVSHEDAVFAFYPQLGVQPSWGQVFYLDMLAVVAKDGMRHYLDIEIDGPWHNADTDRRRAEVLRLPTVRFKDQAVDQSDFVSVLLRRCLEACG